jgi:hypothetical protein
VTAANDQNAILQYLYRRIAGGDERYCTIPTIKKNSGVQGSNQYILALTDDLETAGYAITRQAYQMSGGRLFQITAAGIDLVERGQAPNRADSAAWTGRFNLSEYQKAELRKICRQMKEMISAARLSNSKTANAIALVECAEKLIETPDPLWPEIMRLFRSPALSGITGIAGLIVGIVGILMSAASS